MTEITSNKNELFRRWSELSSARGIKKHNEFILMGEKLIEEFLKNPQFTIKAELLHEGLKSITANLNSSVKAHTMKSNSTDRDRIPVFKISKELFNELDVVGTHYNLLILETKPIETLPEGHTARGLEVICPLGDPGNLGALARSALAFKASKLILTEESCSVYHPKAIKASAGALLKLPLYKIGKFRDFIQHNRQVYALDMKGESVAQFKWPKNIQLIVGEEGPGFGDLKGLQRLCVPTEGVESLNATVAASVALFTYAQAHK